MKRVWKCGQKYEKVSDSMKGMRNQKESMTRRYAKCWESMKKCEKVYWMLRKYEKVWERMLNIKKVGESRRK